MAAITVYTKTMNGIVEAVSPVPRENYVPLLCDDPDIYDIWQFFIVAENYLIFDSDNYFKPLPNEWIINPDSQGRLVVSKAKVEHKGGATFVIDPVILADVVSHINDYYDVDFTTKTFTLNLTKKENFNKRVRIEELKQLLISSDYKVVKNNELIQAGLTTEYDPLALHYERQSWRDEINMLEAEISESEQYL